MTLATHDESICISECAVHRSVRADVPGRRGLRGGSPPPLLAGRLRLPGLREQERDSAQAEVLRPPLPRLQEADLGDGRDVHAPLACTAEELIPGPPNHDFAFERDVGVTTGLKLPKSAEVKFPSLGATNSFREEHARDAPEGRTLLDSWDQLTANAQLAMDCAYKGDEIRRLVEEMGMTPVVPPKANLKVELDYNR